MATISVVIPAYNQADFLGHAIQSVLDQSFTDFELIVVNDGSTDHTKEVLTTFDDRRIKIITQDNGGLLAARNTGLRLSTAPFVTFLDADDLFLPDRLTLMHAYLEQHTNIGMVVGATQFIDLDGKIISERTSKPSSLQVSEILLDNPIPINTVMLRREWIDHVGGFEKDRLFDPCGDWDLWLRLATAGCHFEWLEQPVGVYRMHPAQMTQDPIRMRDSALAVLDKFFNQNNIHNELSYLEHRAYASVYVKSSARAYLAGLFEAGKIDLGKAVEIDPSLKDEKFKELVKRLVGWARSPQSSDPEIFLTSIKENLPTSLDGMKPALRQAIAAVILDPIFNGTLQQKRTSRREIIRAIRNDPAWLLNRGVLRTLAESYWPLVDKAV